MPIPLKAKKRELELTARERVRKVTTSNKRKLTPLQKIRKAGAKRLREAAAKVRDRRNRG